jgi:CRP-like cAMP-binding protein
MLAHAAPETVHKLAQTAKVHRVAAGEKLFSEGDAVDRLYILRSGSMTLARMAGEREVIVAYCAAGKFVDLVGQQSGVLARTVTAKATVASEAISVDYMSFCDLQAEDKQLEREVHREAKVQLAEYTRMKASPEASQLLSFLFQHGVGEATNVLVIDESLCVGCDQCEIACASTHSGVSPGWKGRAVILLIAPAHVVPPLRASALHEGLPAECDSPHAERRSVHQR